MNDVDLFKKFWFIDYLDRLDFKRSANGDGCEAVIAAVRSARAKGGLPAYGIVDRDVWRKRRDFRTLLELDDEAFKSRLIEDGVRVTLYWEIEAYLLEPDALVAWAALNWPKAPMEPCSEAEMVDTFAQVCACVLELTALNALRHKMSIREIPLFEVATEDHGQVRLKAEEHMAALAGDAAWHPSHEQTFRELMELTDTIRTERQGRTGMEAVRLMLRFCDTKVVFKRLANAFKIDDDRPWQLAPGHEVPQSAARRTLKHRGRHREAARGELTDRGRSSQAT